MVTRSVDHVADWLSPVQHDRPGVDHIDHFPSHFSFLHWRDGGLRYPVLTASINHSTGEHGEGADYYRNLGASIWTE